KTDRTQIFAERAQMIQAGNTICEWLGDEAALADAVMSMIAAERERRPANRRCFVLRSLKRPQELERLRGVYGGMFYAIGVFADKAEREKRLTSELAEDASDRDLVAQRQAHELVAVDENERSRWGQKVSDTFAQVDYVVRSDAQDE